MLSLGSYHLFYVVYIVPIFVELYQYISVLQANMQGIIAKFGWAAILQLSYSQYLFINYKQLLTKWLLAEWHTKAVSISDNKS